MADALGKKKKDSIHHYLQETFPLLTSTRQTESGILSEDPRGPVKACSPLDGIHGRALVEIYLIYNFHVGLTTASRHI